MPMSGVISRSAKPARNFGPSAAIVADANAMLSRTKTDRFRMMNHGKLPDLSELFLLMGIAAIIRDD